MDKKSAKKPQLSLDALYQKYWKLQASDFMKADMIRDLRNELAAVQSSSNEKHRLLGRIEGLETEITLLKQMLKEKNERLADLEYLAQHHAGASSTSTSTLEGLVELIKKSNLVLKPGI